MGIVDHDGISVRYVDPILDDLSRYKHIVLVVTKVDEDLLHLLWGKPTMCYGDTSIRDFTLDESSKVLDVVDAAIHTIHLSVSAELKAYRFPQYRGNGLCEYSLYGTTVSRWGV